MPILTICCRGRPTRAACFAFYAAQAGELEKKLQTHVYFADPRSHWQRGSNENFNGLLRQYFPRAHDFNKIKAAHLKAVEDELNDRPRKRLGYRTPREVFFNHKLHFKV